MSMTRRDIRSAETEWRNDRTRSMQTRRRPTPVRRHRHWFLRLLGLG